jgi:cell division protease FtsH
VFLGEDLIHTRDYSEETARVIDEEVAGILEHQAQRARSELLGARDLLDAVAGELLEHETLDAADIARILEASGMDVTTADDGARPVVLEPHRGR